VNTFQRQNVLTDTLFCRALKDSIEAVRAQRPFTTDAFVPLPDHLHCLWTSPPDDADYAMRWSIIKRRVSQKTRDHIKPPLTSSRETHRELG
jgi:putative transposase